MVEFTLDGRAVTAPEGELLVHAAARHGTFIPTLCHDEKLDPYGGCRVCVVDVEGASRPLDEWLLTMEKTSICGLGQASLIPVRNALRWWPELFAPLGE